MQNQKPILVFKIGTSSITDKNGNLDEAVVLQVAHQIALLHKKYHIVMVSSGAVGTGKKFIKNYTGKIEERKAAAAIGMMPFFQSSSYVARNCKNLILSEK